MNTYFDIGTFTPAAVSHWRRVAGVGWLLCTAAEFLRAFVERIFRNVCDKNIVFHNCGKTGNFWLSKDLHTHTQARSLKHPFRCLDIYKSSPKAGSPKALWKQALQKFSQSSTKARKSQQVSRQNCDKSAYVHYGGLLCIIWSYFPWDACSTTVQCGNWLKTYPKKTILYHFHAEKALFKVQNLQHKFLDWKWPPPPPLELFRKFIRFGVRTRP